MAIVERSLFRCLGVEYYFYLLLPVISYVMRYSYFLLSSYYYLPTIFFSSYYYLPTIFLLSSYYLPTIFLLSSYYLPTIFLLTPPASSVVRCPLASHSSS